MERFSFRFALRAKQIVGAPVHCRSVSLYQTQQGRE